MTRIFCAGRVLYKSPPAMLNLVTLIIYGNVTTRDFPSVCRLVKVGMQIWGAVCLKTRKIELFINIDDIY